MKPFRKQTGFTLIELLIIVAIIGVSAAVGMPMYNGYIRGAKINATKENHNRIKDQIAAVLTNCSTDTSKRIQLKDTTGTLRQVPCSLSTVDFANVFVQHFSTDFKNPYGPGDPAVYACNHPGGMYGRTCLWGGGRRNSPHFSPLTITTALGLQLQAVVSTIMRE